MCLLPSSAIEEEHGGRSKKSGVIGDFKASRAGDRLELSETCAPDSSDVALATMAMQAKRQPGATLQIFSMDFAHAYKHVGAASGQEEYAAFLLRDEMGQPRTARLRAHPCGSRHSPGNWARAKSIPQFPLLEMFDIWLAIYLAD